MLRRQHDFTKRQGRRGWRGGARALGLHARREHTEWPANTAPVATTGQLLGLCVLKGLYTEVKEVKVATAHHSGQR